MKKLKSINDFSEKEKEAKLDLTSIYGGKMAPDYSLTGCNDSLVCDPPCADCSDKD